MPFWSDIRNALPFLGTDPAVPPNPPQAQPNQAQPNVPLPDTREVGGALAGLKALKSHFPGTGAPGPGAPMPQTSPFNTDLTGGGAGVSATPFRAQTTVRASRPAPQIAPRPDQIRTPKANASMPIGVASQHPANVKTSVGENDRTASLASLELRHDAPFDRHLARSFPPPANAAQAQLQQHGADRGALMQEIRNAIPQQARGEPPLAKARYLGHALAEATGGDVQRARDALQVLSGQIAHPNAQQERDAFATRCVMARSHASFRALRDVEAAPPINQGGPVLAGPTQRDTRIHEEADWQTWRAAGQLLTAWPAGQNAPPAPRNLDELARAANAMLPAAERDAHLAPPQAADPAALSAALADHSQAAKALLCSRALLTDVNAQPPVHLRSAYLAHRNGIAEADLGQVQSRMYAFVKYAQRNATSARTGSWLQRTAQRFKDGIKHPFGFDKNPAAALEAGTAGGLMDHPEEDFSTLHSIDVVVDHLNQAVVAGPQTQPGNPPDAQTMDAAVRAAALRQWKNSIGAKGWLRDDMKLGYFQRDQIASDVADALHTDKATVRNSPAFRNLPLMNAQTLRNWAQGANIDMNTRPDPTRPAGPGNRTLGNNLDRMQTIRQDPVERPATPEGNIDSVCHLIENIPRTWSVQMSSGGVYGLDANISENFAKALGLVGAPSASVAPDVRYLKGRHAVLEVGSTSHHGEMFIGTDNRKSAHLGVSGFIGWSLAGGKVMASFAPELLGGRDTSNPRGVVLRAPYTQAANPGNPDAWRGKLTEAVRTIGTSGPGGQLSRNKDEMWNGMAQQFFADPDLSIGWVDNTSRTNYAAATATAGVRYVTPANVKFGPLITGELIGNTTKAHATDESGRRTVDKSSTSHRVALNGSATLVASPTPVPVSGPGPFNSLSFSSVPLIGFGTTILQSGKGSTLRLYEEDGEIVPDRTYRDTEFTRVGDYLQYVDSRNDAWAASMAGDQNALNLYQTKVKLNATRGNQFHGERQRMVPEAAAEINAFRGAIRMYEQRAESGGALSAADQQEMLRIRGEIARVLEAPGSWTNQVLYSYESNSAQRTHGVSYVLAAQSVRQVSAQRELSALPARA
ncbi:hypothetical protein WJ542_22050 [Paraburkholderia sp. B3]|uniref:hypothetical protein n=1 Tax=Paraburkholderia sp. B3 TaxID=3134791 RepID=UPI0039826DF8